MIGLYIHIPFCNKICDYCDFFTIQGPERLHLEYLNLLSKEMHLFVERHLNIMQKVETLYLGGGTPSLLNEEMLEKLFSLLREVGVPLKTLKEATMEFNPESCTEERIDVALENGINRISLGLQTFKEDLLNRIGRKHTVCEGINALERLLTRKNVQISADLMFNLPSQTTSQFLEDLDRLSNYPLGHISFYGLKVDLQTRLGHRISKGQEFVNEDLYAEMYREGVSMLSVKGFERYETSNFARQNQECLHNLNYWRRGEYIAFGPGAHGFLEGVRYCAPERYPEWRRYVNANCPKNLVKQDFLGKQEELAEYIQLSLRTKYGLNQNVLKKMGFEISEKVLLKWINKGYLKSNNGNLCLEGEGWIFMDSVVEDLYCCCKPCSNLE